MDNEDFEDSDDDFLFAPDGTPVSEAELEIIHEQYDVWAAENASVSMPFSDYVKNVYFAGCPAITVVDAGEKAPTDDDDDTSSSSMYPNLLVDFTSVDAPSPLSMTTTATTTNTDSSTGAEERLPVLERDGGRAVPVLERYDSIAHDADACKIEASAQRSVPGFEPYAARQDQLPTLVLNSSSSAPTLLPTLRQHVRADSIVSYPPLHPVASRDHRGATRASTAAQVDRQPSFLSASVPTLTRARVGVKAGCCGTPQHTASNGGETVTHLPDWAPDTCAGGSARSSGAPVESDSEFIRASELADLLGGLRGLGSESFFNSSATDDDGDDIPHRHNRRLEVPGLELYIPRSAALPSSTARAQHQQRRRKCPVGYALDEGGALARSSCAISGDAAMTAQSRAVLQHAFSVIRDQFSADRDPALFTQRACCSQSSLAGLAAELRGALASVEASDWTSASEDSSAGTGRPLLLSQRLVRSAAIDGVDGDRRIAFVASATVLAGGLAQSAYSDTARAALAAAAPMRISAITDPFVRAMHEAWYRLMKQAQKAMGRDVTGAAAISAAFVLFGPISTETTRIDRKTDKAAIEALAQIWGAMAATITITSLSTMLDKGRQVSGALAWADALAAELQLFSGMQLEPAANIGQSSLLTETTIAGKVKKGLRIIVKAARDAQPASRIRTATDGTNKFLLAFVAKLKKPDRDAPGRKSDFIKAFLSATCGIIFMRDVERNINGIDGLEHLREPVVLTPMRSALSLIEGQRDTLPQ